MTNNQESTVDSNRGGAARTLLWLGLAIGVAGSVVTSSLNVNVFLNIAFGLVSLACAAVLAVHHYRIRRR